MPVPMIKTLAQKSGKSETYVESLWHSIKKDLEKEKGRELKDSEYAVLVSILKQTLHLRESFKEFYQRRMRIE